MNRRKGICCVVISALAVIPAFVMAQGAGKNPPGLAQSQVILKWQTPTLNDFPFESSLQLDFAPELVMASFVGLASGDGSAIPGTGSRTTAIPMVQNETVARDLAGRLDPGLRCRLASADWSNLRLEFRVFAIK